MEPMVSEVAKKHDVISIYGSRTHLGIQEDLPLEKL